MRLFLLAGSSGLPSSLTGVDLFREIGEMGTMVAIRDRRVVFEFEIISGNVILQRLNGERNSSSFEFSGSRWHLL